MQDTDLGLLVATIILIAAWIWSLNDENLIVVFILGIILAIPSAIILIITNSLTCMFIVGAITLVAMRYFTE